MPPGLPTLPPLPAAARLALALVTALFLGIVPPALSAQEAPRNDHGWVASVNPVFLVFMGIFHLDVEQTVSRGLTLGPSVFYHHAADRSYAPKLSADAVFRYYPSGRSFSGFAVGAVAGFTSMEEDGVSRNAMGLGFTGEHHWLVGDDERLAFAVGVGGKRLFYFSERGGAWRAVPLLRASMGWTF